MRNLALSAALALLLSIAAHAAPVPAYSVTGTIAGPDGGWDYASVDSDTHRLFVAHGDTILAIDLATGAVLPTLALAHHSHAVLPIPGSGKILETEGDTASVRLIDAKSGAETATIAVGVKPDAAIWDAVRKRAIVMNAKSGTVMLIDPATAKIEKTITLKPGLESAAVDHAGLVYVNNEDDNEVILIDIDHARILAHIALPGCEGPTGMAFAPRAGKIVSACGNGVAVVIDPKLRKAVGTLAIGHGADAAFVDPVRHIVFVPGGQDATLSLFSDLATGLVPAGVVPTEKGARTGAVDPDTGRVYLPTAITLPAPPGGKRSYQPGSFHVVVVSPAS